MSSSDPTQTASMRARDVMIVFALEEPHAPPVLTQRERDVVRWSAEGKTAEDTGAILGISPHTVGEHLKNIRRKLGTLNGAHTVAVAIRRGELQLDALSGPGVLVAGSRPFASALAPVGHGDEAWR